MRFRVMSVLAWVIVLSIGLSPATAQEAPPAKPAAAAEKPGAAPAPAVPEDAKRAIAGLQAQAAGFAQSMAVLQKELDGIVAEFQRTVVKLQKDGYDLDLQTMTYVPKKPADSPKKDEPKK